MMAPVTSEKDDKHPWGPIKHAESCHVATVTPHSQKGAVIVPPHHQKHQVKGDAPGQGSCEVLGSRQARYRRLQTNQENEQPLQTHQIDCPLTNGCLLDERDLEQYSPSQWCGWFQAPRQAWGPQTKHCVGLGQTSLSMDRAAPGHSAGMPGINPKKLLSCRYEASRKRYLDLCQVSRHKP